MERYTISVETTPELYIPVYREHMGRQHRQVWRIYRSLVFTLLALILYPVLHYTIDPSIAESQRVTLPLISALIAPWLFLYALFPLFRWIRWWRASLKQLRYDTSPKGLARLDYTLEFDDEEILVVSNRELRAIHWEAFDSVDVTPLTVYLVREGQIWGMFSRNCLGDAPFNAMAEAATKGQERKTQEEKEHAEA